MADTGKAFLNIGVQEIDREVLRFLWIDDLESDNREILFTDFAVLSLVSMLVHCY